VKPVKLYVCWGAFHTPLHTHVCAAALDALRDAGHDPDVERTLSFGAVPGALQTPGRKKVHEHTGSHWVPALELDDGTWIGGSEQIIAWAQANKATSL
jgi:6,7-dimethyl-8-ribityllumazine synthase